MGVLDSEKASRSSAGRSGSRADRQEVELVCELAASGEGAQMDKGHMGSIDAKPVRVMVEEILEGGKVAFETRRRKYGF